MAIPTPKKYIADFEGLGLGMFIHWGLYSQQGRGEWTYNIHHQKMEDYKKLKDTFTAEDFDAEEIVLMAKNAGCRYITLTTRHHEGFSLYDTCGLNDFDAPHSPAGRDLIREFVDACNKHGIVPFFYHTTLDWYNPDFENDFDKYLEYLRRSVEILCTNYGKIGGLWFDGNWSKPDADWKEDELYATIRKHQPDAMIINNTGIHKLGNPEIDSLTFENGEPSPIDRDGMPKYLAAETCLTVNNHWGIGDFDIDYKSPSEIIRTLCNCRRYGANLLLNIGPKAQGAVDPFQKELFGLLGRWMGLYGEAIYEGKPYDAYGMAKNFILKGKDCLYLFFTELGTSNGAEGKNVVVPNDQYFGAYSFGNVKDEISSVEWMDNGEALSFSQGGDMLTVNATGFYYGFNTCVRVAKAKLK